LPASCSAIGRLFAALVVWVGLGMAPALAISPTLDDIQIRASANATILSLRFLPQVPIYQIERTSATLFTIQIPDARVASGVPLHLRANGMISSVAVSREGHSIIVRFTTKQPATLNVTRLTSELSVAITPLSGFVPPASSAPPAYVAPTTYAQSGTITTVVQLKYADLKEVAQILTGQTIIDAQSDNLTAMTQQGAFSSTSAINSSPLSSYPSGYANPAPMPVAGETQSISQAINEHVSIDRRLNALILTGTSAEIQRYTSIIKQVDIPDASLASVTLQTQIVELTENAARNIGIDFSNNSAQATASFHASAFNLPESAVDIQAELFAQIQHGNGELLAEPRIQTLDGTPASILTGDALPILTTIVYPGVPPTIQQQLQYVNVGVHLQVQPFVTSSGYVTSRIVVEVSNVTGFLTGNIPQISERQAVATARVRDGQPFVIGGLLQDNELKSLSKLPLLGDLPLIGGIFRTTHSTMQKTNLYVIVTPHIVRSP
jgi:general secretion pathway protein D